MDCINQNFGFCEKCLISEIETSVSNEKDFSEQSQTITTFFLGDACMCEAVRQTERARLCKHQH